VTPRAVRASGTEAMTCCMPLPVAALRIVTSR
jgi:hypothetical protein